MAAKITSLPMEINLMTLVALPTSKDTVCVCVCVCVRHTNGYRVVVVSFKSEL